MIRAAVADQVGGNHEATVEHGCQAFERGGVVQPAMQGQHRYAVFRPPATHGNFNAVEV
ncbi:hypothetical protein D3C77_769480 [compost metagenome]